MHFCVCFWKDEALEVSEMVKQSHDSAVWNQERSLSYKHSITKSGHEGSGINMQAGTLLEDQAPSSLQGCSFSGVTPATCRGELRLQRWLRAVSRFKNNFPGRNLETTLQHHCTGACPVFSLAQYEPAVFISNTRLIQATSQLICIVLRQQEQPSSCLSKATSRVSSCRQHLTYPGSHTLTHCQQRRFASSQSMVAPLLATCSHATTRPIW